MKHHLLCVVTIYKRGVIMIYKDIRVPMPEKKIIYRFNQKFNITYVYYTVKAYRNKSGKPTSKVVAIGKKDIESGQLIPNENYFNLFKNAKKPTPAVDLPQSSVGIPKQVQSIGNPVVMHEIAQQTQLLATLKKTFPHKWEKILAVASYMISEGNVMMYIDDWFDETKVDFTDRFSDVECSRLFESITKEDMHFFFTEWMKCRKDKEYLVYDVTSISSYSQNLDLVEWGYNRDDDKLPQINFGMFYGMTSGLPVYYHTYNGSIPDKTSFKYMMLNAIDVGVEDVCFVFDKGNSTAENIDFMYENDYTFVTSMSGTRVDAVNLIDEVKGKIEKTRNWIPGYNVFGVQLPIELQGREIHAHIYFNPAKRAYDIMEMTSHIDKLKKELEKVNKAKYATKRFTDYFIIDEHSKNSLSFTLDEDKVDEKISRTGFFILLSSEKKLTSEEVLKIYRNKDVIEKNFEQFKNYLDFKRLKTHHNKTTEGKMFTGFVALILRSYMSQIIRTAPEMKNYTFEKVMLELKKIKSVKMTKGKDIILPLTKTQKTILACLKIDEKTFI